MESSKFSALGLAGKLLKAIGDAGYTQPTPIQEKAIPILIDKSDMIAVAQTGTGKTAAFTLPLLQKLEGTKKSARPKRPKAVILTPTRELASQISDNIRTYSRYMKIRQAVIMGGVKHKPQIEALRRGPDILVATPGRLLDLIEQRHADMRDVNYAVLDEADRMLDMGFVRDVREIFAHMPAERQTLLFSATMPREIEKLGKEILNNPQQVRIEAKPVEVGRIKQSVEFLEKPGKLPRLIELLSLPEFERVIVFVQMKYAAERVAKQLTAAGIPTQALHGNKSQGARQRSLDIFRKGKSRVLVATDIASRGIDVDKVTHVINYDMPEEPESYVHRIGRTARAGNLGEAITFCQASDVKALRTIERMINHDLDTVGEAPAPIPSDARTPGKKRSFRRSRSGQGKRRNSKQRSASRPKSRKKVPAS
ncbi:MAG: DEAD/DEAH box helicase [Rhizobiaceae bacterium]